MSDASLWSIAPASCSCCVNASSAAPAVCGVCDTTVDGEDDGDEEEVDDPWVGLDAGLGLPPASSAIRSASSATTPTITAAMGHHGFCRCLSSCARRGRTAVEVVVVGAIGSVGTNPSARCTSSADAGRSPGSFAIKPATSAPSSAGTVGTSESTRGGVEWTC